MSNKDAKKKSSGIIVREKILNLCRKEFMSSSYIADYIGMSLNTIRAHYLYPMARDGLLERKLPEGAKRGQAYKAAAKIDN